MIDHTCDISEICALADTLVELDRNDTSLYNRAAPFLIRILAERAQALNVAHTEALEVAHREKRA